MEAGIAFGLCAALSGAIELKDGRVQQSNFHDYQVLRLNQMPAVEVHIVPSTEKSGGAGEPGTPPIAPAVANAIAYSRVNACVNCRYDSAPEIPAPDTVSPGVGASVGGQRAVIDTALALHQTGRAFALAVVFDAEGSTYRKPGALALIADDGRRVGVISGGCLEPASTCSGATRCSPIRPV